MKDTERRVEALEKKMSGLEEQLRFSRERITEMELGCKAVLLEFCSTYGLNVPDCLKQTESQS